MITGTLTSETFLKAVHMSLAQEPMETPVDGREND